MTLTLVRRFLPLVFAAAVPLGAQTLPTNDPVLRRIWQLGMDSSQTWPLSQALLDSVGPRLTGSPGMRSGQQWLLNRYAQFGITAREEKYGTWRGWRRGTTHVDLIAPRVRSLEGTMLSWSPGTGGRDVQASVVILPDVADSMALIAALPQVRGKFVLVSYAEPTCRPDTSWKAYSLPGHFEKMDTARTAGRAAWSQRVTRTGYSLGLGSGTLGRRLEQAGAAGIITARWSQAWGVEKIFDSKNERAPAVILSCEDYSLVYRLAERNQNPQLRVRADAEFLGEVPVYNVIGEIKGSQLPNEYVMLSAHFDSWDSSSGATDNGTGTVVMMEAMRLLKATYPNPKRTIIVGHWSGEEQGLVGSRSFAADHPEVVSGLQVQLNQDNGTGRVANMSAGGLVNAGTSLAKWLSAVPAEIMRNIRLDLPGSPAGGGSDNASFICYGAPGLSLGSLSWEYGTYTWHTNRDTFDKISFEEVKSNATLTAMLAYLASEDPQRVSRDRRENIRGPNNAPATWPTCARPPRTSAESTR